VKSFSRPGKSGSKRISGRVRRPRNVAAVTGVAVAGALALSVSAMAATDLPTTSAAYNAAWQAAPSGYTAPSYDGLGVSPGTVGHVWVIVLENHASEASFTPLEGTQSSYLQQLPDQGALLTHYYGTGHSSLDNYVSMFSGQAPQADDQSDCNNYSAMDGSVDTSGTPATNADFGQLQSNAGPDAPPGDNGCVYPSSVNTVFNQLQAADKSWKVYAEDLGGGADLTGAAAAPVAHQDAGYTNSSTPYNYDYCGAPDSSVAVAPDQNGNYGAPAAGAGTSSNANFASTNNSTTDTYVAKHDPLPWFSSITGTPDTTGGTIDSALCSAESNGETSHLGPVFGANDQLYGDLQSSSTTPDLSVIIPNNCSDGHDGLCKGNNLSGGTSNGYTNGTINQATSDTGGTVAESNFLGIVIPEIEKSPAFQQNGMIVVTYDEAYPPFAYSGDSQASSQLQTADAASTLTSEDSPGETLYGRSLNWEPTGPNTTVVKSALSGQELSGGPGDDAYLDLPTAATGDLVACPVVDNFSGGWASFTTPKPTNGSCVPGYQANSEHPATASIHLDVTNGATDGTTLESEAGVSELDEGAQVTTSGIASSFTFPADGNNGDVYIGQVTNAADANDSTTAASNYVSTVNFVDNLGAPLTYSGTTVSQLALALSLPSSDPFYDPYDATMGGGDAGAVVISPFVKPGTVSNSYYNHYSLLRTIEDIFGEQNSGSNDLTGGITPDSTTETTLNGPYLGFAGQPGLAPFGHDIFDVKTVNEVTQTVTSQSTVTIPGGTTTVNNNNTTTVNNNNSSTVTVPGPTVTVTKIDAIVPELKGYTLAQAKKAIKADGLKLGAVSGSGSVFSSSPTGGREVKSGTPVSIKLKK
jgi:hypothetical protein